MNGGRSMTRLPRAGNRRMIFATGESAIVDVERHMSDALLDRRVADSTGAVANAIAAAFSRPI
jgi:hypothetical protein